MRVVFAGTPEVAAAGARGRSPPSATSWSAWSPAPTRRPAAAAAGAVAGRRSAAEELGVPVLKPEHPRDPEFQEALRALAPGLLPGGRVRRAAAAVGARHPARTAGSTCTSRCCPPGAARRRCSTRSGPATRSPARPRSGSSRSSTPARRSALMTETDPARPTPPATCSPGSPRAVPGCWSPPSTASRTARSRPARSRPTGVSFAPKITVDDARVDWTEPAVAVDRRVRACTPAPGRLDDVRRRAGQARPGHRRPTAPLPPGELRGRQERRRASAPAPAPCGSATVKAVGKQADAGRRLGARASGSAGGDGAGRESAPADRRVPRTSTRSAGRCPRSSSAPRGATARRTRCRQKPKGTGFVLYRAPRHDARRPRDRRGVRRPARDHARPTEVEKAALVEADGAVLHHRPLQQLQRRAGPAVRLGELDRRRAARGASPTRGWPWRRSRWPRSSWPS